jgi:glycosyltransferase involved in cell wall biosynthesis
VHASVVFPLTFGPEHLNKDPGLIPSGLAALGCEVVLYCDGALARPEGCRVVEADGRTLRDERFWSGRRTDLLIAYTWAHDEQLMRAARGSARTLISKCDSDGLLSLRRHPFVHLRRMLGEQRMEVPSPSSLRVVYHWARRIAQESYALDRVNATYELADWTVIETRAARGEYLASLPAPGKDGGARCVVISNPVASRFVERPVEQKRAARICAVGRWEDPRKNAPALGRALRAVARRNTEIQVDIFGGGGESVFRSDLPNMTYHGFTPHDSLLEQLAVARIAVSSSRSEGSPIASHEALALGCSVVGPRIPAFRDIVGQGPFGTLAGFGTWPEIARAVEREFRFWEEGRRNPQEIASFWRARAVASAVAQRFLDLGKTGA